MGGKDGAYVEYLVAVSARITRVQQWTMLLRVVAVVMIRTSLRGTHQIRGPLYLSWPTVPIESQRSSSCHIIIVRRNGAIVGGWGRRKRLEKR